MFVQSSDVLSWLLTSRYYRQAEMVTMDHAILSYIRSMPMESRRKNAGTRLRFAASSMTVVSVRTGWFSR